ncbi:hypothetical protein HK14_06540 [Acetobacter cibinongensis]|uniref:Uncharacterized protein n=1 Tax=Acetobacter cibinongensis TaxID=146475 RepID=A0A1Z5YUM9_9PROT|nr:hypothetical protein HK14_06540 [Acetobacter cibinongensis]
MVFPKLAANDIEETEYDKAYKKEAMPETRRRYGNRCAWPTQSAGRMQAVLGLSSPHLADIPLFMVLFWLVLPC